MKKQQPLNGKITKITKSKYIDHKLREVSIIIIIKQNNKDYKTNLVYEYRPILHNYSKESKKLAIDRNKYIIQKRAYPKNMNEHITEIESKLLIGQFIKIKKTKTWIQLQHNPLEQWTWTNTKHQISKDDIYFWLKLVIKMLIWILIFIWLLFILAYFT